MSDQGKSNRCFWGDFKVKEISISFWLGASGGLLSLQNILYIIMLKISIRSKLFESDKCKLDLANSSLTQTV